MSHKRLTNWQKATALVPLALLSGAWTTSLAVTSSASASTQDGSSTLPDGTTVPDEALEAPASMSSPGSIAPGVPDGAADAVIDSAATSGIPAAALAAYQRAEQIINSADASCNLSWQLVAAIGRVESDHGRYGGNVLGEDGRSEPGIYGIPLDGSNGTAQIRDTDGGQFDDDPVYDRAVGPMQFIPQTWSVVGVDGDSDGKRDPQDIDDAALATAVYLCSGEEDLSTSDGQRSSVYRYNHSQEYVDLVIAIMNAYLQGEFTSVPNGVATSTVFSPSYPDAVVTPGTRGSSPDRRGGGEGGSGGGNGGSGGSGDSPSGGGGTTPVPGGDDPSTDEPGSTLEDAVKDTTDTVQDTVNGTKDTVGDTAGSGGSTLTEAEARAQCLAKGIVDPAALETCIANLLG